VWSVKRVIIAPVQLPLNAPFAPGVFFKNKQKQTILKIYSTVAPLRVDLDSLHVSLVSQALFLLERPVVDVMPEALLHMAPQHAWNVPPAHIRPLMHPAALSACLENFLPPPEPSPMPVAFRAPR